VCGPGTYIVTAGTYRRERLFSGRERIAALHDALLGTFEDHGWHLQAWAVFENHYHVIGISPGSGSELNSITRQLHGVTAHALNKQDGTAGRVVWHGYWQTMLTHHRSYLARLNYVHQNAVRHGLVQDARDYPWCSASWFERHADLAWQRTVGSFGIDRLNVPDDF